MDADADEAAFPPPPLFIELPTLTAVRLRFAPPAAATVTMVRLVGGMVDNYLSQAPLRPNKTLGVFHRACVPAAGSHTLEGHATKDDSVLTRKRKVR